MVGRITHPAAQSMIVRRVADTRLLQNRMLRILHCLRLSWRFQHLRIAKGSLIAPSTARQPQPSMGDTSRSLCPSRVAIGTRASSGGAPPRTDDRRYRAHSRRWHGADSNHCLHPRTGSVGLSDCTQRPALDLRRGPSTLAHLRGGNCLGRSRGGDPGCTAHTLARSARHHRCLGIITRRSRSHSAATGSTWSPAPGCRTARWCS